MQERSMEREKILERICELGKKQPWNHSIELVKGVFTCPPQQHSPGKNLVKWERMKEFLDLFSWRGKRILDVGCNDGFFSLKLAELGAAVVALEASPERAEKAGFVFEVREMSHMVKLIKSNIQDLAVEELGHFDLVLCMGFIHRVPDPFAILSKLAGITNTLLLEFKAFVEYAYDRPYLMFDGRQSDPEDPFSICYFVPSARAVVEVLKKLGVAHYGIIGEPKARRVMLVASKKESPQLRQLNTLQKGNLPYLIGKFTRRFGADIFKAVRGDFEKE